VRGLGDLEAAVMDCLWSAGRGLRVREAQEMLADRGRDLAYTTVMTVMDNLYKKEWLRRERVGRGYVYEPAETRAASTARLMHEVLDDSRDRAAAFMHFVDDMSSEDTATLTAALQVLRRRRSP
jgi:predicted transcriptional regulator